MDELISTEASVGLLRFERSPVTVQAKPSVLSDGSLSRTPHEIIVWLGDDQILSFDLLWISSSGMWMSVLNHEGHLGVMTVANELSCAEMEAVNLGHQEPDVVQFLARSLDPLASTMLASTILGTFRNFLQASAGAMKRFRPGPEPEVICVRVARGENNLIDHFIQEANGELLTDEASTRILAELKRPPIR